MAAQDPAPAPQFYLKWYQKKISSKNISILIQYTHSLYNFPCASIAKMFQQTQLKKNLEQTCSKQAVKILL